MGRARDVLMRSFLFLRSPPPPTWCYTLGVLNVAGYIFPKGRNWKGEGEDERGCIKPRKRQETIRRILFSDPLSPRWISAECSRYRLYRANINGGKSAYSPSTEFSHAAFYQNGYRSEDALFFAGQIKPRAPSFRPVPREIGGFII